MSKYSFRDKVVIITGSTLGIGKSTAFELVRQGAKLVINGRNRERLEKVWNSLKSIDGQVLAIAGDVTNINDCRLLIDKTIERFGRIDVLINNAGLSMRGEFQELDPEVFERNMDVNYLGAVFPTTIALPHILKSKGSIMFVSSLAGIRGLQGFSAYCASKMALTAIAESLKIELAGSGVHVGIIYVGITQIDPDKRVLNSKGNLIPLSARSGANSQTPEKVANAIIRNLKKRRFKSVLTTLGKVNLITNILIPRLADRILIRANKKVRKLST